LQLGGGLMIAVIIPWLLRRFVHIEPLPGQALDYTPVAAAFGVIAGYWGFRKISAYPGVRPALHILPAFTLAFGAAVLVLFFGRLHYSRFLLLLSYTACIAWYYVVYFKLQRQRILTIGIVPCGDIGSLYEIEGVRWVELAEEPEDLDLLDAVVADLRADIPSHWERFLADQALHGKLVLHKKQIYESLTGKVAIDHLSENNFGSLVPAILYLRAKRVMDVGVAILLFPFLAPILLLIGLAICLDSPGPALFRQERMGHRGRKFMMYKFRTMTWEPLGLPDRHASITHEDDSRITRVGRFLRKRRIDELPQVLNILRGEMSWIGPRPEAAALSLWYEAELPFYRYRHIVPPGISGWAQVKQGHVSDVVDVRYKLHYDFYYIKNFSLWLDILIAASTLRIVLNGFGSR
jgi:lipopolysaccharide/colanic/teichoic acid biosynthesis glycosyltransferase